ncbi:hypothetical protein ACFFNY_05010 [Paenibacillus hodogayensis]|uniref:Uncharacterized protein n=1 Tax=Paenibacillus hodogayensis TaxID=279208 RepID=A0ABV5VRM3_9BACL
MKPNAGKLANWLLTWVQEHGTIHGFHNHSVWGSNPYRWSDFTCDHSTWASPLLPALALMLNKKRDPALESKLLTLIRFQTGSFQPDGQYAHIGFQMGESLAHGLIHNMMPNAALGLTALYAKDWLPADDLQRIRASMEATMDACDRIYPFGVMYTNGRAISNQEYARLWGKLLYEKVFGERRWGDELRRQVDEMIGQFHVGGLPDPDCIASYRYAGDTTSTEPAEYYGLLIAPLVLASELYGEPAYLEQAGGLCRHLARSAWHDGRGQTRLHRVFYHSGSRWVRINEPMLIAGMGISLFGIHEYLERQEDTELAAFLAKCDRTYAAYQNPRGYFASATGWCNEADIAPSSAWHAHDLLYLIARHGADDEVWSGLNETHEQISVLLGDRCIWMERGPHWTITDYQSIDVYQLLGRKDETRFGRDMNWVGGERALPERFTFADRPVFVKTDEGIFLRKGGIAETDIQLSSVASVPYLGVWS